MSSENTPSLADHYSQDASGYLRHWAPVLLRPGLELLAPLPLESAARVLEVGAGVGLLMPHIAARLPAGGVVVAADRAVGMIRLAPPHFPRVVMDAARLGFGADSFDVVVMAFMLFHLPDPVVGLCEARRVLRPGGRLALATWAADPSQGEADRIWNEELDRAGAVSVDPWPARHELMDTPEKVTALLAGVGFEQVQTTTRWVEDPMDCDEFLARRTTLGFSGRRFASLPSRQAFLRRVRTRLARLPAGDFTSREKALLAWASRP